MVRFVKKYLVLMVVAVLFVGAFLLNLKTNAAKTGSGEGEAFHHASYRRLPLHKYHGLVFAVLVYRYGA